MKDKEEENREELVRALNLIDKEEEKINIILAETEKKKEELIELKLKLAEVDGENSILKQRCGWQGITDEEMKWVMKNHPNGFGSFLPSLGTIRSNIKNEQFLK